VFGRLPEPAQLLRRPEPGLRAAGSILSRSGQPPTRYRRDVVRPAVDPRFAETLRRLRLERGLTLRELAALAYQGKSTIHDLETGRKQPLPDVAKRLDDALQADGELVAMVADGPAPLVADEDGLDALELARRVAASDISSDTLGRLERAVDDLATAYATTPPELLLPRVRRHIDYVARMMDVRKTLDQHRRRLVAGGWLSLLSATVHIDLRHSTAADAHLGTAREMAGHAEHPEIQAWCLETQAWDMLTSGDFRRAVELSQQAQAVAPRCSSAHIQATAQEGRAWARMRKQSETRDALDRVTRLASSLHRPERPEHHYQYDPAKALSYTATTLAWVGDPSAEEYARAVIAELETANDGVPRPRRIASARLDLGLALLVADKPDEASAAAIAAITSGRVVPSNWWRATEVLAGVERAGVREASDLRDAYEAFRPVRR
jgi:transcriptional regulator with XRE-family HTH domain